MCRGELGLNFDYLFSLRPCSRGSGNSQKTQYVIYLLTLIFIHDDLS
jgi:hypothetical protein